MPRFEVAEGRRASTIADGWGADKVRDMDASRVTTSLSTPVAERGGG